MADEKLLLQTVKDTAEVSSKSALIAEDENQSNKDTFVETSIEYLRERLNYVYPGAGDDNLVGKKDATEIKNDRDGDQVSDKNTESESDGFIGADSTNDDSNDLVFWLAFGRILSKIVANANSSNGRGWFREK